MELNRCKEILNPSVSKLVNFFMCLLFASIISISGIRYFIGIQESSIAIYAVYILAICLGIYHMQKRIGKNEFSIFIVILNALVMVAYGFITSPKIGVTAYVSTIKMIITFLVAYCFFLMDISQIRITLKIAAAIILVYSAYLIIDQVKLNRYLSGASNYLVLTLPIGLYCSLFLSRIIYSISKKHIGKRIIFDSFSFILTFIALTRLPARGSTLFPFFVGIVVTMMIERKYFFKLFFALICVFLLILLSYSIYMSIASDYAKTRMLTLFSGKSTSAEDRIEIYALYSKYIITHLWVIWGGGVGASVHTFGFYPHNFYLQLFGEFGLIGIISGSYLTYVTAKTIKWFLYIENSISHKNMMLFYELFAGMLYLFLCFMKSFSFYDICSLLIFVMSLLSLKNSTKTGSSSYEELFKLIMNK